MTTLLLVRHGQSMANLSDTFAGHTDVPLSDLGKKQAKMTAAFIAENYNVSAVYSSDLLRALATAQQVAGALGLSVTADKGLREIYGGEWEGVHYPDLPKRNPKEFEIWSKDIGKASCPAGESVAQLQQRLMTTLRRIAKENEGKTVVIASHGCAIRSVMSYCSGQGLDGMQGIHWVSNASVTEIVVENDVFELKRAGLDAHLKEFTSTVGKGV